MARTRVETRARARALQALYAWDMRGDTTNLEKVATQVWDDMAITPEERRVAGPIVRLVATRRDDIDAVELRRRRATRPAAAQERDLMPARGEPPKDLMQVNLGSSRLRIFAILPVDEKQTH